MKNILFLSILFGLYSCDDGDLQIEQVNFDESTIEFCPGSEEPVQTTFFFKIDEDEALLLNLADGLIQNQTSEPGTLTSTIPEPSKLIYRFFSDNVTSAYFCDAVPPIEPTVVKENLATAGNISVDTKVDTLTIETKEYSHTISIKNLSLVNDQGEQLTDLSTLVYGNFSTRLENSARLEVPFSNYSETTVLRCATDPNEGNIRLYKLGIDEFIALDIPVVENLFVNMPTSETGPRVFELKDTENFKYIVLDTLVGTDLGCSDTFGEDIKSWRFVSTSGTLKVETVASTPDENGSITYSHTISLENLILTSKANGTNTKNVNLEEIPVVEFGTYTTVQE